MVKVIEQNWFIHEDLDGIKMLKRIERIARVCYKSEERITKNSYKKLCKDLVAKGHFAMLEHGGLITVDIISNRGLSHELVRHRLASYAQESTRYCNYNKEKHNRELTVIKPLWIKEATQKLNMPIDFMYEPITPAHYWLQNMLVAESTYKTLIEEGKTPQEARGVLPIDVKTHIVISANPTEWRHILKLRTSKYAHPQIREIMLEVLNYFQTLIPIIFDDIGEQEND